MSAGFPCLSCLEPLPPTRRYTLALVRGEWQMRFEAHGNWCGGCAIAAAFKRNLRAELKAREARKGRR